MSRNTTHTTISQRSNKSKFKLDLDYSNFKLKEGASDLQNIYLDEKDEIFSDDSAFERDSDCQRGEEEQDLDYKFEEDERHNEQDNLSQCNHNNVNRIPINTLDDTINNQFNLNNYNTINDINKINDINNLNDINKN